MRHLPLVMVLLCVQAPLESEAQTPPAATVPDPEYEPPPAPLQPDAEPALQPAKSEFDFDLLDKAVSPTRTAAELRSLQKVDRLVKLRRRALIAHQTLGFITLVLLSATVVIGHLNYHDQYVSGDLTGRYATAHLGLGIATTTLFTGTGVVGLLTPNVYRKPIRFDTTLVHKVAMALATVGMLTEMILGPITASRVGRQNQADLALGHVVVGYATWGFMLGGVVAYVF